jgi:hypothetical protein
MSTAKNPRPSKKAPAPSNEDRLARSFSELEERIINDYEEKNKELIEKMRQRRVNYVVKDLPIY